MVIAVTPRSAFARFSVREHAQATRLIGGLRGYHQQVYARPEREIRRLGRREAGELGAQNPYAREYWMRALGARLCREVGARAPDWTPRVPVFFVTLIDESHLRRAGRPSWPARDESVRSAEPIRPTSSTSTGSGKSRSRRLPPAPRLPRSVSNARTCARPWPRLKPSGKVCTVAAKPAEASSRLAYEELDRTRHEVRRGIAHLRYVEGLRARRARLAAFRPTSVPRGSVTAGIGGVVGHELATTIQSVLHAWRFPGLPTVAFDPASHDILINGKNRRANGKGVRALMNAAFKIGVMLYCRSKELPHPGIVALDSPLLSYRDSLSRHGAPGADEKQVAESGLNAQFYRFLLDNADKAQFVVIENDAPPFDLGEAARVTTFVGSEGSGGRRGFFPA